MRVELVDPPAGVELDPSTSLVTVPAPDRVDAPSVSVVYSITNGLDSSRAVMKLETAADINNPPVVYDAFGRADDSESVTVGVLDGAYDPDGPVEDLRVAEVLGDPAVARIDGDRVKANRAASPLVVPFRVEDGDGASARRPRSTCRRPAPASRTSSPAPSSSSTAAATSPAGSTTSSSTRRVDRCG